MLKVEWRISLSPCFQANVTRWQRWPCISLVSLSLSQLQLFFLLLFFYFPSSCPFFLSHLSSSSPFKATGWLSHFLSSSPRSRLPFFTSCQVLSSSALLHTLLTESNFKPSEHLITMKSIFSNMQEERLHFSRLPPSSPSPAALHAVSWHDDTRSKTLIR